jgi:hypothetical protein
LGAFSLGFAGTSFFYYLLYIIGVSSSRPLSEPDTEKGRRVNPLLTRRPVSPIMFVLSKSHISHVAFYIWLAIYVHFRTLADIYGTFTQRQF